VRAELVEQVGRNLKEDARVGDKELRLVAVAHKGESPLQRSAIVGVCDLRGEVVPLNAVGVREEAERVINGEAESSAPPSEAINHLGRQS